MEDIKVYTKEVNGQTVNFQEITTETVIANPSAEASEQLEKLQVGNTVYNMPEGGSGGNYVLELTGESGTLTDEQYQAVVDNFPNVVVKRVTEDNDVEFYPPLLQSGSIYNFSKTFYGELGEIKIIRTTIVSIRGNKTWDINAVNHQFSASETFKTKLTTEFGAESTTLNETDTAVFLTALETNNVTPISQVVFDWTTEAEEPRNIVGVLSNSYIDFDNNTVTLIYKNPIYKLTIVGDFSTYSATGVVDYNEPTTSSGGLTKTKVTLAELQALMTDENIGTIVGIASKIDVSFATLGLPEVFIITQNTDFGVGIYGDGSLVGAGTENNFVITSVSFSIRANNKKMELRAMNLGGSPLAIDLGTPQDMSEMLLIDDNFAFYIYK